MRASCYRMFFDENAMEGACVALQRRVALASIGGTKVEDIEEVAVLSCIGKDGSVVCMRHGHQL